MQLAQKCNIHPVIAVAGNSIAHVETLINREKGDSDTIIDYRQDDNAIVESLKIAANGFKLNYAFDAVSEHGSYQNLVRVLEPDGILNMILPGLKYDGIPESMKKTVTNTAPLHDGHKEFGFVYPRLLTRGLQECWLRGQPYEIRPRGLEDVEQARRGIKAGKAKTVKYRISDTSRIE
jgi:hypothetical protein